MSPRRQTIPIDEVRAPPYVNDQLTPGQVRQDINNVTSLQGLVDIVASQLRIVAGAQQWLEVPPPGATSPFSGELVVCEALQGDYDGQNVVFETGRAYVPGTLSVRYNGIDLAWGPDADYLTMELQGPGTGFNGIKLTGMGAPGPRDRLQSTYVRVV